MSFNDEFIKELIVDIPKWAEDIQDEYISDNPCYNPCEQKVGDGLRLLITAHTKSIIDAWDAFDKDSRTVRRVNSPLNRLAGMTLSYNHHLLQACNSALPRPRRAASDGRSDEATLIQREITYSNQIRNWYIAIQEEYNRKIRTYNLMLVAEIEKVKKAQLEAETIFITQRQSYIDAVKGKLASFYISDEEVECCLSIHLKDQRDVASYNYKSDTLTYFKVLNRYARENDIRVEDAKDLFLEYINNKPYTV
jgi:hypothetical protein